MKHRMVTAAVRGILWLVALLWAKSLRIRRVHAEPFDALRTAQRNFVAAFWHGSMFVGWFLFRPQKKMNVSALVSQSKDGEYLSLILERWGYSMIRGSSHIGGKEAMDLMVDALRSGSALAITPDGPRGPRYEMKMGAVRAAQRAGVPLVLAGIAMERKRHLRSWDRFEVPAPFSRVTVCFAEPVMVPPELTGPPLDEFKQRMQQRMNELNAEAERIMNNGSVHA